MVAAVKIELLLVILLMTVLGAVAGLFLKRASGSNGIVAMLFNINLYIGGSLYLVAALLNIYVLRFMEYSVVLPLTSITYIWTMVVSYLFLKEKITKKKIAGVCLIVVGAIVLVV